MEARDLRVSDAEREHVGELLQRAVGQGMLSLGEFTERMDTALAAKTRGELNAVLVDLPGIQLISDFTPPPYPARPYAPQPVAAPHPVPAPPPRNDVIRGRMSSLRRTGPWNVPPSLAIETRFSTVDLDFTRAVMSTQVVHLVINDYGSTITLTLPPEATVDLNGLETVAANATNRVRTGPPIGPLHLVVHGKVRFGNVTARHSYGTTIRKLFR
ncbi:MAG: DUF1707 domain-containing protein [Rhodococcus sp. (in: high G+C Gram-positive bacteria)]|uniref:DUF1707 SHOCT-like domain-containing protein n=1 Tax=Rhodococcus sp. TaxID=1831 RepID=UPI003BB14992